MLVVQGSGAIAPYLTISTNADDVELSWNHLVPNETYEVWVGTLPDFISGDSSSTLLDTVSAAPGQLSATHQDAATNADTYFYVVVAKVAASSAISNRVGKFAFAIEPGSP